MMAGFVRLLSTSRLAQLGAVALVAGLAFLAFKLWLSGEKKEAATVAVTTERAAGFEITINRMEAADHAAETIHRDPVARNAECLRHARNPEDC